MGDLKSDYARSEMKSEDYVYVHCDYVVSTRDAVLVIQEGQEHWLPRSCLGYRSERDVQHYKKGDRVTIQVKQWLAEKKELEYD